MLNETLWTYVITVIPRGETHFVAPSQRLYWLLLLQKLNCFLNCLFSFLCSEGNLAWSLKKHAIELLNHCLEVVNEHCGLLPQIIVQFKNLLVDLLHTIAWHVFTHFN